MALIDTLVARRQKLLVIATFGFTMWQGGQLLEKAFPADDTIHAIALAMILVGALQWAGFSIGILRFGKSSKPEEEALNDELTKSNRAKAFMYGYTTLLGCIGALFAANSILSQTTWPDMNADIITHALLIIGVVTPMVCFIWLERSNG